MSNELIQRLDVLGDKISQKIKNGLTDHYAKQLVSRDFNWKQRVDIVVRGLTGHTRREKKWISLVKERYASSKSSLR